MIGRTLAHYRITAAIGAGGMGEVYRATDSKLGRDVALKVLPAEMATDPNRLDRFQREAKALAALDHPGIVTVYSVEEADGVHFLTMQLVEGEPLHCLIPKGGLPVERALEVATAILDALASAHEKGIVHRDLKPGNIMVTNSGRVKVLDFGLAKMSGPGEGVDSNVSTQAKTGEGVVMGTRGYMSPEQVRGLVVEQRSDIFSFGTILYELLSGKKAFKRDTAADTMAAILNEEPPDLSLTNSAISPGLDRLIRHCLEKNPERRFSSAHDIALALDELSSPAAPFPAARTVRWPMKRSLWVVGSAALVATAVPFLVWRSTNPRGPAEAMRASQAEKPARIVVLPFENLGAPQDDYFAKGMTEEIMSRLANLQGLAVISRTTAIGYDRKGKTVPQIGADLGVDFVLEGTVRWDHSAGGEGRVRIALQLILANDDNRVWGERYDRVMADTLTIQSDVAQNVVNAMGVKLAPREKTALQTASTRDPEAYDLYLRGLEMVRRGNTRQNLEEAVRLLRAAVDRDPRFAQALAQLVEQDLNIYFLQFDPSRERVDRAKQVVDQLEALGPDLPETHIARAYYLYWGLLDYPRALEEFKVALPLQPSNGDVLYGIASIMRRQGRWEEAADEFRKWLEIDPRSPAALNHYGRTCLALRRYAEADRALRLSAALNPQWGTPSGWRAWTQVLWRGDAEKARSTLSEAGKVGGLEDALDFVAWCSFRVALIQRDFQGALRRLEGERREAFSNMWFYLPLDLLRGDAQALSGQTDQARRSFDAARRRLEALISKEPDDSRYYSALGIACAGLGLRAEALRGANRGVELMPMSKDAWRASYRLEDLALVHTMLGEQNEAIEELDVVLSNPGEQLSAQVLRVDPLWDSLRSDPRFEALLAKYIKKT